MKFRLLAHFSLSAVLALSLLSIGAAHAAGNHNSVVVLSLDDLDASLAAQVENATIPVVLEFYDAQDPDASGECRQQLSESATRFSGKVALLRAEVHSQSSSMIESARIAVCPTHLFVLQKNGRMLVTKRVWGYLDESQFQELFKEFYGR